MKKLNQFCLAWFLLVGTAIAQSAPQLYKQVAKFDVGGDGGWDYITYDASSNRLFIGHSMEIAVVDVRHEDFPAVEDRVTGE